jgi:uncharacterized protein YeaO (DUF488 family)
MRNDTVVMTNDKVYTSYFARASKILPNRRTVSIALTTPENWGGAFYRKLNPTPMMIHNIKNNIITFDEYEEQYRKEILSTVNPEEVYEVCKGKAMCCWEKSGEPCHRHIVINWLSENLGNNIIGGEV